MVLNNKNNIPNNNISAEKYLQLFTVKPIIITNDNSRIKKKSSFLSLLFLFDNLIEWGSTCKLYHFILGNYIIPHLIEVYLICY